MALPIETDAYIHGLGFAAPGRLWGDIVSGSNVINNISPLSWIHTGMKVYVNSGTTRNSAFTKGSPIVTVDTTAYFITGMLIIISAVRFRYTGTTVIGSKEVNLVSSFRAMTNMGVEGTGIPAGAVMETYDVPGKKFTMDVEATASATGDIWLSTTLNQGIPAGTTILSIDSPTQITLSENAVESSPNFSIGYSAPSTSYIGIPEGTLTTLVTLPNTVEMSKNATETGRANISFEGVPNIGAIEMVERVSDLPKIHSGDLVYEIPTFDDGGFGFRVLPMTLNDQYGWKAKVKPPYFEVVSGSGGGQIENFLPTFGGTYWPYNVYTNVVQNGGGALHIDFYSDIARTNQLGHTESYPASGIGSQNIIADSQDMGGSISVDAFGPVTTDLVLRPHKKEAAIRAPKRFSGTANSSSWHAVGNEANCQYQFNSLTCFTKMSKAAMIPFCNWTTQILPQLSAAPSLLRTAPGGTLTINDENWDFKLAYVNDFCFNGTGGLLCYRWVSEQGSLMQVGVIMGSMPSTRYDVKAQIDVQPIASFGGGQYAVAGDVTVADFTVKVMEGYSTTGYWSGPVAGTFSAVSGFTGEMSVASTTAGLTFELDTTPYGSDPRFLGLPATNCWYSAPGTWCNDFLQCWGGYRWEWGQTIDVDFAYKYTE